MVCSTSFLFLNNYEKNIMRKKKAIREKRGLERFIDAKYKRGVEGANSSFFKGNAVRS